MTFHCPLCEQEIETDSQIVDGQRLVCPWCEQNFTFYTNVPELPLPPLPPAPEPLIIASGEEFEEYLCGIVNDLADVECEQTKATGDQGVDLVITLKGGERIAVQCKLYSTPVGNEAVQQVVAGRIFYKCDMAAVVTNSTYTDSAIELAQATGVTLLHYKQLKEYLADNGVGTKSKARQLAEVMMRFEQVHPAYFDEIDFLLAYKTGSRWRFSCEKTIFHLRKVVESLKKNGRRPMRETMQLMHLKICDVCDSLMLEVQYGSFGKTLARIYESFDTSGKTADIRHLDGATRQELLRVVKIVIAAGVAARDLLTVKDCKHLKDQIFKDEIPDVCLPIVEKDLRKLFNLDKEMIDVTDGDFTESYVRQAKEDVQKLFGISWSNIVKFFESNR